MAEDYHLIGPQEHLPKLESNGGMPVNIQDQTSLALDLYFIKQENASVLLNDAVPEDRTIDIVDTSGFVDGCRIGLFSPLGNFYFGQQIGAPSGNTITLDTPIDRNFPATTTTAICATKNMNVDGSTTTQIFQIGPVGVGTGVEVDITRIMGYLEDNIAMDDAKFGGITALTNGIVLRHNNSVINNIWNIKTNGEFGLLCFDTEYTEKAPAGSYGFRFRNTYAGQSKHGVTIRLAPGETLQMLIQDDLTGLTNFQMMAQGHVVTD